MPRFDGSLARTLDFGDLTAIPERLVKVELRLAARPARLAGPDKYRVLAHRRHQAQINARRLLDLLQEGTWPQEGTGPQEETCVRARIWPQEGTCER
jgi:hypothetical protein